MAFQWMVETDWLAAHLNTPDIVVLDGSLHLPTTGRNAKAEYDAGHIPGALFFDIDAISDKSNPLPHMLPSLVQFASRVKKMGIGDGMRIVVYDSEGLYSAARVWWMFRIMGHEDVRILNGGLKKWKAEGREIEDMPPVIRDRHMTVSRQNHLVKDVTQVAHAAKLGEAEILDARAAPRFRGEAPEPRAGLRSGHIPGSKNIPFAEVLNPDGTMKPPAALKAVFEAAGVDLKKPAITSCGSGVTAAVLSLALERIGHRNHALYDGSWAEWGMYDDLRVATGP